MREGAANLEGRRKGGFDYFFIDEPKLAISTTIDQRKGQYFDAHLMFVGKIDSTEFTPLYDIYYGWLIWPIDGTIIPRGPRLTPRNENLK